jgi:hypothetical protein
VADDAERDYYRAVEDLFASLRGVPHTLSPKDMHLLRSWWRDGVPLTAVAVGLTEVFQRRRERGDDEPITALAYCRHAVHRHTRRLAELHAGARDADDSGDARSSAAIAADLETALQQAAHDVPDQYHAAAGTMLTVAAQLRSAADLSPAAFAEHLFTLEAILLEGCWAALPESERSRLAAEARSTAASSGATGAALRQTTHALRDRSLRRLLGLPRLEVP